MSWPEHWELYFGRDNCSSFPLEKNGHLLPWTFVNKRTVNNVCGQTALYLESKALPCSMRSSCFKTSNALWFNTSCFGDYIDTSSFGDYFVHKKE